MRTRQPLRRALVAPPPTTLLAEELRAEIADELNVGALEPLSAAGADLVDHTAKGNFRALGKRFAKRHAAGGRRDRRRRRRARWPRRSARRHGRRSSSTASRVEVLADEVIVSERPREGWAVVTEQGETVALDLELTDELRRAGLAREVVRMVQEARKASRLRGLRPDHADLARPTATTGRARVREHARADRRRGARPTVGRGRRPLTASSSPTPTSAWPSPSPAADPRPSEGGRPGAVALAGGIAVGRPRAGPQPGRRGSDWRADRGSSPSPSSGEPSPPSPVPSSACELLAEVALQAAAVLPLEGPQVLDLAVEAALLLLDVAEQLAAAGLGLAVEVLRAGAGLLLELVGLVFVSASRRSASVRRPRRSARPPRVASATTSSALRVASSSSRVAAEDASAAVVTLISSRGGRRLGDRGGLLRARRASRPRRRR